MKPKKKKPRQFDDGAGAFKTTMDSVYYVCHCTSNLNIVAMSVDANALQGHCGGGHEIS